MAQYDFGTIDPNTKSGTALASDLNSWRNAVHSTHSAATAPSYLVAGMLWADTTSANYELKMYDGAQWIPIAVLDATNNVARVAVDGPETSYITSTTAAQIRHVIASTDIFTTRSTGIQFNIASPVIADSNNNELISFTTTASAVNQINVTNAATNNPPTISTVGGDTNINLLLTAKGTGVVYTYSETAATNTVIDVARIEARSTGTPAAGIGTGLLFAAETAANNFEIGARIEAVTTDVTATSEDFDLIFRTMAAGATAAERFRISSLGALGISGANYGTAGQVLTSGGSGGAPSWATAAGFTQDVQEFTSSGTWTKPANAKLVVLELWGAGGGGGSGRRGASATDRLGGAGGGGSPVFFRVYRASELTSTVSVTVGAGGAGGAAQTVNTTNGNNGTAGGNSSFGSYITVTGGGGGPGGTNASAIAGGTAGQTGDFTSLQTVSGGVGGATYNFGGESGQGGWTGVYATCGGGAGGAINSANTTFNAGVAGSYAATGVAGTIATGVGAGVNGAAGSAFGIGGAGGGFGVSVNAGSGGAGGTAAGGGGGGGSLNGFNSGAGGAGGNGFCRVTTYS